MAMIQKMISVDFDSLGNVSSLIFRGVEFIADDGHGGGLFQICLRDFLGNPLLLECKDFGAVHREDEDNSICLVFSECNRLRGTTVKVYTPNRIEASKFQYRLCRKCSGIGLPAAENSYTRQLGSRESSRMRSPGISNLPPCDAQSM